MKGKRADLVNNQNSTDNKVKDKKIETDIQTKNQFNKNSSQTK